MTTQPWGGLGLRVDPDDWRRPCIFNCKTPCASGCVPAPHHGRGRTPLHACRADQRFSYCLYVPTSYADDEDRRYPLIVLIHGTERSAQAYRDAFAAFAEAHDCIVLAPLFPCGIEEPGFEMHNYKFIDFRGIRFDELLLAMVDEVGAMYRLDSERFLLFGFSGGGQFAHRFFYLRPNRLLGVSIGAPGWVTLLDLHRDWWIGVRDLDHRFGRALDFAAMRQVAVQMVIGGDDIGTWDVVIPEGSRYWMPGANDTGTTRVERLDALRKSFEDNGITVRLDVVPGVGHDGFNVLDPVKSCFAEMLVRYRSSEPTPVKIK